ncbi:uncharacterized protein MCYG_05946 [Microsporum canis CBS 113480]|uniref:Secreted protein n=1 Tax=Arthroderma otae (strain ATCC MYA-4605 / CBS 113480) TaxID=554155 RepID=C5FTC4_ARTOC|nr:uncharacterized protein MCYG_05946 [Microsporum canis CBS 113480]EEQ33127.1 predicted protein [Microsporum canis CBS 113480]
MDHPPSRRLVWSCFTLMLRSNSLATETPTEKRGHDERQPCYCDFGYCCFQLLERYLTLSLLYRDNSPARDQATSIRGGKGREKKALGTPKLAISADQGMYSNSTKDPQSSVYIPVTGHADGVVVQNSQAQISGREEVTPAAGCFAVNTCMRAVLLAYTCLHATKERWARRFASSRYPLAIRSIVCICAYPNGESPHSLLHPVHVESRGRDGFLCQLYDAGVKQVGRMVQ